MPARAGRVVTLSEALDGHLSSVGLVAVGAVDDVGDWLALYRPLLDAQLDLSAIPAVGSATEPNYEAIAGLRPELIIAEDFSKDLYPKLAAIAPIVLISRPNNAAWKSAFDQTVTAVGRDEEAESVWERYLKTRGEVSGRAGRLLQEPVVVLPARRQGRKGRRRVQPRVQRRHLRRRRALARRHRPSCAMTHGSPSASRPGGRTGRRDHS